MFSKTAFRVSLLFSAMLIVASSYGANFTYDGVNRRDPENDLELRTIEASGEIFCIAAKTGQLKATTGFLLDLGQEFERPLLITSGHTFKDVSDDALNTGCYFRPYNSDREIPLENNFAGALAQANPANFIKNDWGVSILPSTTELSSIAIPISNRTHEELHGLLRAGQAEIKFYGGNQLPLEGEPRIQISDNCSIWEPTPRAILGAGHSLYTNCDSTGSSSGGPLVIEMDDGSIEAIGIMFGAIHTVSTVNQILGDDASTMTIRDVEHAINYIPSPETIINIAVPLIPGMREQGLSDIIDEFIGLTD